MTFARPPRPAAATRRRRGPLGPTVAILIAIVVLVMILAQVWTEVLWYRQVGFLDVLTTQWLTRAALFVGGFLVMGSAEWGALRVSYQSRPVYAPTTPG